MNFKRIFGLSLVAAALVIVVGCDSDKSDDTRSVPAKPGQAQPGKNEPGMTNPMQGGKLPAQGAPGGQ